MWFADKWLYILQSFLSAPHLTGPNMCRGFIGWKATRAVQTLRSQTTSSTAQASRNSTATSVISLDSVALLFLSYLTPAAFVSQWLFNLCFYSSFFCHYSQIGSILWQAPRTSEVKSGSWLFPDFLCGEGLFSAHSLPSIRWATLIIHDPHVLQTDYKHLHLTTIIIIITAGEFYSPSCYLWFMPLRFNLEMRFKGRLVYAF